MIRAIPNGADTISVVALVAPAPNTPAMAIRPLVVVPQPCDVGADGCPARLEPPSRGQDAGSAVR
jgi:hypothetical protein